MTLKIIWRKNEKEEFVQRSVQQIQSKKNEISEKMKGSLLWGI